MRSGGGVGEGGSLFPAASDTEGTLSCIPCPPYTHNTAHTCACTPLTAFLQSSGRGDWKLPANPARVLRNPNLSTSWEKKMKDKAEGDSFKQRKRDAEELRKATLKVWGGRGVRAC